MADPVGSESEVLRKGARQVRLRRRAAWLGDTVQWRLSGGPRRQGYTRKHLRARQDAVAVLYVEMRGGEA